MPTEVIDIVVSERGDGSRVVKRNLDDLGKSADGTALSVGGLHDASTQATAGHERHTGGLVALKREMAGTQRTVNFFARGLNDAVPASSALGEGLRVLGAGLVHGFGLGLGIEVLLVGVKLISERFTEWREKTEALQTAQRDFTQVSKAELEVYGEIAERVAETQHKKFDEVFLEMTKAAQQAYLAMQKAVTDYELALHKLTPAEKLLHDVSNAGLEQRKALTEELWLSEGKLAKARRDAAKADEGSLFSAGPDIDRQRREAHELAKALHEVQSAKAALAAFDTKTSRGEALAKGFVSSEEIARRGDELVAYTREENRIEMQAGLLNASQRRRLEIETDEAVLAIRKEWAGKTSTFGEKLEGDAIRLGAARKLQLEKTLAREHAAEMRALQLELVMEDSGIPERVKAEAQAADKITGIEAEMVKKRDQADMQGVWDLYEKRGLVAEANAQKLLQIDFKAEKAKHDMLLEMERTGTDEREDAKEQGLTRRDQTVGSPLFAGTQDQHALRLRQEQVFYAELEDLQQRHLISAEGMERAKTRHALQLREAEIAGTREFFGTLATMQNSSIRELAMVGKAAAIAQATIDGILAVQKALATFPPPLSFAIAAAVGVATAANVAQIAGITGFESGGYTGDLPSDRVAGVVHGREFVSTADATSKYRPVLEAMNAGTLPSASPGGGGGGAGKMTVNVVNQAPGVAHEARQISANEVEIIARSVVHRETPRLLEGQLADSNSRSSRALQSNTTAGPRR